MERAWGFVEKDAAGDQSQQMDGGYNMHYDNTDNTSLRL